MLMRQILDLCEEASPVATLKGMAKMMQGALSGVDHIEHVEIDDGYISIEVASAFDPEAAKDLARSLDGLARVMGWFVSKVEMGQRAPVYGNFEKIGPGDPFDPSRPLTLLLFVFPLFGKEVKRVPNTVYHLTTPDRAEDIRTSGLRPSTGGLDFIVMAQPRIYLITNRMMIEWVAADFRRNRHVRDLIQVEVSTVLVPGPFYKDVEWEDGCVWTPNPIPAHRIRSIAPYRGR